MSGWPRYLAATQLEEARLAAASGDLAGARAAYAAYLRARPAPDAALVAECQDARRRLAALGR